MSPPTAGRARRRFERYRLAPAPDGARWHLGWDIVDGHAPARSGPGGRTRGGTFTAELAQPAGSVGRRRVARSYGHDPGEVPTLGHLEALVGRRLPVHVACELALDALAFPGPGEATHPGADSYWLGGFAAGDHQAWRVGWDPGLGSFFAEAYMWHNGYEGAEEVLVASIGVQPGEVTTVALLAAAMGRPLPAVAAGHLQRGRSRARRRWAGPPPLPWPHDNP